MERRKIVFSFFISFLCYANASTSQSYPDAGSWNTVNIEYGINTKSTLLFTEEFRVKENFSRLNLFYTNVGFEYKITKFLKTALIYRFIEKYQDDNSFSFRHRLMLDFILKDKVGKFDLSYRQRFQAEERDIYSSEAGKINEWYSRNKFTVKYDLDKLYTPYVAIEVRYQLHNPRKIESDNMLHRSRYYAGIDYKKNERSAFGIYYMIQHEYNVLLPQDLYIIGLEYTLTL